MCGCQKNGVDSALTGCADVTALTTKILKLKEKCQLPQKLTQAAKFKYKIHKHRHYVESDLICCRAHWFRSLSQEEGKELLIVPDLKHFLVVGEEGGAHGSVVSVGTMLEVVKGVIRAALKHPVWRKE